MARPPMWALASMMRKAAPASVSLRAAASPAAPAPMMTVSNMIHLPDSAPPMCGWRHATCGKERNSSCWARRRPRPGFGCVGDQEMDQYKDTAFRWVERHLGQLSDWNQVIWHYGETALREYKSAAWYVDRLKHEGFEVEAGTG